ncbi:hypothetical protein GCM10009111_26570 [Colwellia asteriadis]|uniref:Uncharacterized protein n=1 Tax=Colwellia asteriadis TaxID=517723 RepID=A0ABN1L966_9GAMM
MTFKESQDTSTLTFINNEQTKLYLHAILTNTRDPIFVKDNECKLILVNNAFCQLFGLSRKGIIGKTLAEKVPPSEREHFLAIDKKVLEEGKEILCEETLTLSAEQVKIISTRKSRFTDNLGNRYLIGVIHDITERKKNELRKKSHRHVLELITSGKPLAIILDAILHLVEQDNPEMICSILLLDNSGQHLISGSAPRLPTFYSEAIHGVEIGIGVGSCGTAAFMNERIIVDDIESHPYWEPYKGLAKEAGLASCWSEPIRSTEGDVLGTFAIYHNEINAPTKADLTVIEQTASLASIAIEKKHTEDKLKLAASVFSHARESIIITDENNHIINVNARFSEVSGYYHEEVLGKKPQSLMSDVHSPEFHDVMWEEVNANGYWIGEVVSRHKSGKKYTEMQTISAVRDEHNKISHYVILANDITSMKEYQKQLEHIAHFDVLTNLPNRVLLADRLSQALLQCNRQKQSLAVVFLDLDGFKAINDAYGHDIGDELLISLSGLMKASLREGDSLARIGGDEFVAVLTNLPEKITPMDYVPILERLLLAASDPVMVNGAILNVSASIGVTLYPQDNVDADQLMRHADQAMYIAKERGKNRHHLFDIAQDDAVKVQREGLNAIRHALDHNEFVLHYQPKVNMRSGTVIGFEALIRWQHPKKGLLSPAEFLPIIENNPMNIEMGEWVINSALTQISQWQKQGLHPPLNISVNIAAVQLQQPKFTKNIIKLLKSHPDVEPHLLELEVLETSALDDISHVSATMNACIKLGVNFALDDFGTGYSSLTYLRRLPASLIKIDQSFVRDMLCDPDDSAIVEGVIALAKSFKRNVIAEGVETIEHGKALLKLGCDLAQGYGIAKPMPANEIPQWIDSWQCNEVWQQ